MTRKLPPLNDSWAPLDLTPYFEGTYKTLEPSVGAEREDGVSFLYPGKEHAIIGMTESGKSWFCLACVLMEIRKGRNVLYIHFEEADPSGSVERLRVLGATIDEMRSHFHFIGPDRPITSADHEQLAAKNPSLVVLDGVNEAMALHGKEIKEADGFALFRKAVIKPWTSIGAAVLQADHVTKSQEGRGNDAYGSVHKGNAIDGARIGIENKESFGRGKKGRSLLFVTKDRPGFLRQHGAGTATSGKVLFAEMTVDATGGDVKFQLSVPGEREREVRAAGTKYGRDFEMEKAIREILLGLPANTAPSFRKIRTGLRDAGKSKADVHITRSLEDMEDDNQILITKRGTSNSYRLVTRKARGVSG